MIRYLAQEEKIKTRMMYESVFPEDSRIFTDYYYKYKTADNQILVMEEKGSMQVMLHLNPYRFYICEEKVDVNYIVAVATDASVRRQGKMAQVMSCALRDMAKRGQPFTFLIPANPGVYLSSGFSFVPVESYKGFWNYGIEQSLQAAEAKRMPGGTLRKAEEGDAKSMAAFANRLLKQNYDIFPYRSEAYYLRKISEIKSQQGELLLLENDGDIAGIFSYGSEEGRVELQELLVGEEDRKTGTELLADYFSGREGQPAEMKIMVRILDLSCLVSMMRMDVPLLLKVQVKDEILPQNCGSFKIHINSYGGRITAITPKEVETAMDISQLAELLFGKMRTHIREWV